MLKILVPTPKVRGQNCVIAITKKNEANLTKLYRKIEHNEKVCHAQELGSYAQGQGHKVRTPKVKVTIRSVVKLCRKSGLSCN